MSGRLFKKVKIAKKKTFLLIIKNTALLFVAMSILALIITKVTLGVGMVFYICFVFYFFSFALVIGSILLNGVWLGEMNLGRVGKLSLEINKVKYLLFFVLLTLMDIIIIVLCILLIFLVFIKADT